MNIKQIKLPTIKIAMALAVSVLAFLTLSNNVSAATITVDTDLNPSLCTLDEAITNINDGAQTYADCVESGAWGTADTITIPAGTVTLTANLPFISETVDIQGAGMGETTIDGDGQWRAIGANVSANTLSVSDLLVTNFSTSAINSDDANLVVRRVEVDGSGAIGAGALSGIGVSTANRDIGVTIEDTYIHDLNTNSDQVGLIAGIAFLNKTSMDITIHRTTVENISASLPSNASSIGIFAIGGLFDGQGTPADFSVDYENLTVSNISSPVNAVGVGLIGSVAGGSSSISGSLRNNTIVNVDVSGSISSGGLVASVGSFDPNDSYAVDLNIQNLLLSNTNNCSVKDISTDFGGTGTADISVTSSGGNIDDNNTCHDYLTHTTDQNNLTNLASTLGPLSDNGGFVPTIPLLQGSPAVDSGVTVPGLTTDARQAVRPQGSAYDSGAYESPYSKPVTANLASTGSNPLLYLITAALVISTGLGAMRVYRKLS